MCIEVRSELRAASGRGMFMLIRSGSNILAIRIRKQAVHFAQRRTTNSEILVRELCAFVRWMAMGSGLPFSTLHE